MEKKEMFRKVGMIMAELNEQYQYLSEKPENLNDLELELFLANSNFLTDHIEILRKLNGYVTPSTNTVRQNQPVEVSPSVDAVDRIPSDAGEKTESEKMPESPAISPIKQEVSGVEEVPAEVAGSESEAKPEEAKPEEAENEENIENTESVTPLAVQSRDEAVPDHADSQPVEEMVKEVVIPEKQLSVEAPATSEESVSIPTINEMISAQVNPSTVAKQFTDKPVADLKAIINLNDKLLFIKDLFNGYSLAYSEAIELLNRFDNFESADNFLKVNYASKNSWNEKQPTVDKLYEILKRRFAK